MLDPIRSAAFVPLAASMLPLVRTGRGWVRIWDFPRPQIAAAAAALIALSTKYRRQKPIDAVFRLALTGCVLYQMAKIWRYTPLHPKEVLAAHPGNGRELSLLIANVYMHNRQVTRLLDLVLETSPDVVCLVETDDHWVKGLEPLNRHYGYRYLCPLQNTYGMVLYSRLPVLKCETRYLVEKDVPSMHARLRLPSGDEVALHCLHPRPPLPGSPSYGRDAELVLVGQEIAGDPTPAVVAGDLNDVAWSYTTTLFQQISGTLDPRVGRGLFNSFHADHPWLRYPLDHVFNTPHFKLAELRRLPHVGSDHFPIFTRLVLSPDGTTQQQPPPMTEDAAEDADEILEDARSEAGE